MSDPILFSLEAGVAEIRFNRPEVLNALDTTLGHLFVSLVDRVADDREVRVAVISGEGRAFMAGGDLGAFKATPRAERGGFSREMLPPLNAAIAKLAACPKPTIACINGAAAGAGMSFALMADLAVAAEDAAFNLSYVKVAQNPDCGGSWALVQAVGLRKAMEIALLSDTLDAQEALRLGLVNKVVPSAELRSATWAMARKLADGPPLALASTKALLRKAATSPLVEQLEAEAQGFARLAASDDFEEALDAFFAKRKPIFTGR